MELARTFEGIYLNCLKNYGFFSADSIIEEVTFQSNDFDRVGYK